jgi:pSer/pThr/pTyr-binding forkhead associated (FHA) protein
MDEHPVLVAQKGPLKGERWAIGRTHVVGRDLSCEIVVPDRQISRFHARLSPTPEGIVLEDLGSKNGTTHNGESLAGPVVCGWGSGSVAGCKIRVRVVG